MGDIHRAIELLRHLVAFDTTSAGSNLELIDFVGSTLTDAGILHSRIYNSDRTKAGLIATIGPNVPGGIVLSGHTDVVPVKGQRWTSDPFELRRKNGLLFGRGTADMKGFLATVLACLPAFALRPLRIPVHLAFSYDEEIGCLGAPALIEHMLARVPLPSIVIIGEPTEMKVANRHRGLSGFTTTITGRDGHSSAPEKGVNAINVAAQCIVRLTKCAAALAPGDGYAHTDADERTTINIGTIEGGTALNIIAAQCRFDWECRSANATDPQVLIDDLAQCRQELAAEFHAIAPDFAIKTDTTVVVPPLVADPRTSADALALTLTGQNHCISAPFATEAGHFSYAGIDAVVCGPGSPAQAHQPNEYVTIEQIQACVAFLNRLAAWMQGPL